MSKPKKATLPAAKKSPPTWKLFFLVDQGELEADFVVARTAPAAKRAFNSMYGNDMRAQIDLVAEIKDPPAWLKKTTWLGPGDDVLEELGGKRVPALHFPRWQFGGKVWGYPKTMADRYRVPTQPDRAPAAPKKASARDREKPIVSMSTAERELTWAEVSAPVNSGLLDEARSGPKPIHVAAIVLVLRDGERRLVLPVLEYGDGEGVACAKSCAREYASALAAVHRPAPRGRRSARRVQPPAPAVHRPAPRGRRAVPRVQAPAPAVHRPAPRAQRLEPGDEARRLRGRGDDGVLGSG
jgi:hypothetical protein